MRRPALICILGAGRFFCFVYDTSVLLNAVFDQGDGVQVTLFRNSIRIARNCLIFGCIVSFLSQLLPKVRTVLMRGLSGYQQPRVNMQFVL